MNLVKIKKETDILFSDTNINPVQYPEIGFSDIRLDIMIFFVLFRFSIKNRNLPK